MQRFAAIVLVLCYVALGSGVAERWHNAQHEAEDAVSSLPPVTQGIRWTTHQSMTRPTANFTVSFTSP